MESAKRATNELLSKRPRLRPFIARVSIKYGGERHKELERFLKFAFVGVMGTVVDLGLTTFLMVFVFHANKERDTIPFVIASTIGFVVAVTNNFIWNRYWTYPDSRSHTIVSQLGQFFAVNIVGFGIRVSVLTLLTTPLTQLMEKLPEALLTSLSISKDVQLLIAADTALISSIVIVMMWNFFVNRYWTYNDVK